MVQYCVIPGRSFDVCIIPGRRFDVWCGIVLSQVGGLTCVLYQVGGLTCGAVLCYPRSEV